MEENKITAGEINDNTGSDCDNKEKPIEEMDKKEKRLKKQAEKVEQAQDKVDHMNYVFDKLIVPIIAFIVVFIIIVSLLPKDFSCYSCSKKCSEERQAAESVDFYNKREVLTSDIAGNRALFEANGWTIRDDLAASAVAAKTLPSGIMIKEYHDDAFGSYAVVRWEREVSASDAGWSAIVMGIYSEDCITVEVYAEGAMYNTVFFNEQFTSWKDGDDFYAGKILSIASRDTLLSVLDQYKECLRPML